MKNNLNKAISLLRKKKNIIKLQSFLFLAFMLGMNTYAWFVYITTVRSDMEATIAGWDITFMDEDEEQVEDVILSVSKMYPGMEDFTKQFSIYNRSDVEAKFEYSVKSFTLLGKTYTLGTDYTMDELETILKNDFPFQIGFTSDSSSIGISTKMTFSFDVTWPYESTKDIIKLNKYYDYSSGFTYLVDDPEMLYAPLASNLIYAENFQEKVTAGLYLDPDDADTYWGEKGYKYLKDNPGKNTITMILELKVTQA